MLGSQLVVDGHKFGLWSKLLCYVTELTLPHFDVGLCCLGIVGLMLVSHVIGGFCMGLGLKVVSVACRVCRRPRWQVATQHGG